MARRCERGQIGQTARAMSGRPVDARARGWHGQMWRSADKAKTASSRECEAGAVISGRVMRDARLTSWCLQASLVQPSMATRRATPG